MAVSYKLDNKESRFTVQAFAGGMLSTFAHNPTIIIGDFTGEVKFASDAPDAASLLITIKADSLKVVDDVSEKDRQEIEGKMRNEVLETSTYSDIVFRSTDISLAKVSENWYRALIKGDLSLHGVTRNEQIDSQLRVIGDKLRASGEFMLNQSEYGIRQVTAVGGAVKLKEGLKFSFEIIASKEGE